MNVETITVTELQEQLDENPALTILDVRTPVEYSNVRAKRTHNVPLDKLDPDSLKSHTAFSPNGPTYVICKMGGRSMQACNKLVAAGYTRVVNVTGGTDAWDELGLPVVRAEKQMLPLDCQVRILAGSLVVIGALLSFLNPWFAILPILIGSGLIYSGATNTCGIMPMISMLPWNRVKKPAAIVCNDGG